MIRVGTIFSLVALLGLLAGTGCNKAGQPMSTPDGTVTVVSQQLAEDKPGILWEALPPSYQKQLQDDVLRAFAQKMDPEIYGKGSSVIKKAVGVLRDKREFILPTLMTNQMVQMAKVDKAKIEQNWNQVIELLDTIVNSELGDLQQLKQIDVGRFLNSTGGKIMQQLSALSALSEEDPYNKQFKAKISQLKAELVRSSGNTASVKTTVPGESEETIDLVKVEGRWLPRDMVGKWNEWVQNAKTQIANMNQESMDKSKPLVMGVLTALETAMDQLAKAKTASEFNKKFKDLMASLPIPGQVPGGAKPRR